MAQLNMNTSTMALEVPSLFPRPAVAVSYADHGTRSMCHSSI